MIVCSCNLISKKEIVNTINELLHADPWRLIVPGVIYHEMSVRGKCCGCFPDVVEIIIQTTKAYHENQKTPSADIIVFMDKLKKHHQECETVRMLARHRQQAAIKRA